MTFRGSGLCDGALESVQPRRGPPQDLLTIHGRHAAEATIDHVVRARPGRRGQREVRRPQDVVDAQVRGIRRNIVEPRREVALAVEHLGGLQLVPLTGEAVVLELVVGPTVLLL